jgi:DNA-binding NarL/FixJ family response regulator
MQVPRQHDPSSSPLLRVLVVDDHRTFADTLVMALSAQEGMQCVGAAYTAVEALALARRTTPDAVVMDVRLGGSDEDSDGISVLASLTEELPALAAVVLTAYVDRRLMERAAVAGACCLLRKDGTFQDLLDGLRTARPGSFVVAPELLHTLVAQRPAPKPRPAAGRLTAREADVLAGLVAGLDAAAVAAELGITLHTCRSYIKNVLVKLGAHSQHQAVAIAVRDGLVDVDSRR